MKNVKNKLYLLALCAIAPAFAAESSSSNRSASDFFNAAQQAMKAGDRNAALDNLKSAVNTFAGNMPDLTAKVNSAEAIVDFYKNQKDAENIKAYSVEVIKAYNGLFDKALELNNNSALYARILLDIIASGEYKNLSGKAFSLILTPQDKSWLSKRENVYSMHVTQEPVVDKRKSRMFNNEAPNNAALNLVTEALIKLSRAKDANEAERLSLTREALEALSDASYKTDHTIFNVEYELAKLFYDTKGIDQDLSLARMYIRNALNLAPDHMKEEVQELAEAIVNGKKKKSFFGKVFGK